MYSFYFVDIDFINMNYIMVYFSFFSLGTFITISIICILYLINTNFIMNFIYNDILIITNIMIYLYFIMFPIIYPIIIY